MVIGHTDFAPDVTVPAADHPPLAPGGLRRARPEAISPLDEPHLEAADALAQPLMARGIHTVVAGFGGDEVARVRRPDGGPARTPQAPAWCGERVRDLLGEVNTGISPATVAPETALVALEVATPLPPGRPGGRTRMGRVTESSPAPKTSVSPQQVGYQSDPHFEDIANASWWRMATRLPRTLTTAVRLGWAADRPAMLWLGLCQLVVAVFSAVALGALPDAMNHLFAGGEVADRLSAATGSLIVVAVATAVRAAADALAVYAAARLAPEVATEADLQILAATPAVELEAYDRPGFTDRLQAAGKGAEATENLIGDA